MQVVDTKRLDLDRVLNLEELRAYFTTLGRYLQAREAEAIEKVLRSKDRESKEKIARPLGKMQVSKQICETSLMMRSSLSSRDIAPQLLRGDAGSRRHHCEWLSAHGVRSFV